MVFYFSGTGNSKYIARRISNRTDDDLYSINNSLKMGSHFTDNGIKSAVFVFPTYAWRIPAVAEKWIRESSFPENIPAYFILNCGGEIGNSEKYIKKLCLDKSIEFMGCAEIVMPENYLAMFSVPNKEQSQRIIAKREVEIDSLCDIIKSSSPFPPHMVNTIGRIMSSVINPLFYALFVNDKRFTADIDKCISCGKCVIECPLNNIVLSDGKPKWNGNCTHCMACITCCPEETIEYGNKTKGKPRYRCPY